VKITFILLNNATYRDDMTAHHLSLSNRQNRY